MLSEEALIFLGGLVALGAVALGVLELLWPARPKRPLRRATVTPEPASPPPAPASPPVLRRWRSSRRRHAMNGTRAPYRRRQPGETETAAPRVAFEDAAAMTSRRGAVEPVGSRRTEADVDAVARCLALHEAGDHAEAVAAATAAMAEPAVSAEPAQLARLWSVVALAREAIDDCAGARTALEAALTTAPEAERPAYGRQLASLTVDVARKLVDVPAGARGPASEEDVDRLRQALDWGERALAAIPGDESLRALTADIEHRLWPVCERAVMTLVQRQQYGAARRLLREALDDRRFPTAHAATFRELLSGTFGGEIGQLTAQAIRSMQAARETEALAALERAEELLENLHDEALPPKRREEVDRRLWWGYKKLGRRRMQAGDYDGAVDALGHALRFAGVGTDREADTRAAVMRAVDGLTEQRVLLVRELADAGDREAALVQTDKLWSRLRGLLGDGLGEADLAAALAKVQQVFDEVSARP